MIIDPRNETPLIYTASRGNFPMAELEFETAWEVLPTSIRLTETYKFKDTGEIARKSIHVLSRASLRSVVESGTAQ